MQKAAIDECEMVSEENKEGRKENRRAKVTSLYAPFLSLLFCVVPSGFEPEQTEPKSVVLPLHHGTQRYSVGAANVEMLCVKNKKNLSKSIENSLLTDQNTCFLKQAHFLQLLFNLSKRFFQEIDHFYLCCIHTSQICQVYRYPVCKVNKVKYLFPIRFTL